ncbi:MAG: hypothetical protein JW798_17225 [Prolixibacteraceae bacterium]|nr:hypothetical protein [Prolixibacteraceae bacterium]
MPAGSNTSLTSQELSLSLKSLSGNTIVEKNISTANNFDIHIDISGYPVFNGVYLVQ